MKNDTPYDDFVRKYASRIKQEMDAIITEGCTEDEIEEVFINVVDGMLQDFREWLKK